MIILNLVGLKKNNYVSWIIHLFLFQTPIIYNKIDLIIIFQIYFYEQFYYYYFYFFF